MRVIVDQHRCEGHGMCEDAAPGQFQLDDEGYLHLRHDPVPDELVRASQSAVRLCPVAALKIET